MEKAFSCLSETIHHIKKITSWFLLISTQELVRSSTIGMASLENMK